MPTPIGTPITVALPATSDPGPIGVGADVPSGANLCLAFLSGSNDAGVTLDALAADFVAGGAFVVTNHAGFTGYGAQFGVAKVTSSGSGKTITPDWSAALVYGPTCFLVFLNVTDADAAVADLSAQGARLVMGNSADTTAFTGSVSSGTSDLVYNFDTMYTTSGQNPGTPTDFTSIALQTDLRGASSRLSARNGADSSTGGTTVNTNYSSLILVAVRDVAGGGGHSATPANSNGGATVSGTTATQNHLGQPAGSNGGATVASTSATQTYRATAAASNSGATVASTTAEQSMAQITLGPLKNNTGTLLASQTGVVVHVYAVATGNKIVSKTGLTTDAAGMLVFSDAAMAVGTEYRIVIVLGSGAEGMAKASAA